MSNYPPYQFQPYPPAAGPYMPPQAFAPRMDMQAPASASQTNQPLPQGQQGAIMGLSPASRPVTSREEAMGVAADFSGAPMIFPDVTHDRVYIKRWDLASGGPAFQEYAPVLRPAAGPEHQQAAPQEEAWAPLQDLQNLQDVVQQLQDEINRLKRPAGRSSVKNDAEK